MRFQNFLNSCFLLLMKSHLQSYPCPLHLNYVWNLGFLLGITIILQIITGIFLGLHYLMVSPDPFLRADTLVLRHVYIYSSFLSPVRLEGKEH